MNLGVLAFGDSITNGGGELQWGVALQSWALWTARALGLPYTSYAVDGAGAAHVAGRQIPAFEALSAVPGARYDVGCLYVGVNDVRALDWSPAAFERDYRGALGVLAERCDRTLTLTIPRGLGVPPAGAKGERANAIIEAAAGDVGALVVDLRSFGGRRYLMPDRVHPTAFGQIAIACKALEVLAAAGLTARANPWQMVSWEETRRGRARGDLTYAWRATKERARAALRVALAAARGSGSSR
jgi:lysophospholipase L1-like esterase